MGRSDGHYGHGPNNVKARKLIEITAPLFAFTGSQDAGKLKKNFDPGVPPLLCAIEDGALHLFTLAAKHVPHRMEAHWDWSTLLCEDHR